MSLINITIMREYFPLSANTPEDIINRMISESQEFDLRPFLGDRLYFQVIGGQYPTFLTGESYIVNAVAYYYEGLEKLLSYYSYARYMRESALRTTSIGLVEKNTTEANKVGTPDRSEENRRRQQLESTTKSLEQYTKDYCTAKGILIGGTEVRKGSIRVSRGKASAEELALLDDCTIDDGGTTPTPPSTGGIPEAPLDGNQYGRQSASWTKILAGDGTGDMLKEEFNTNGDFGIVDDSKKLEGRDAASFEDDLGLPSTNGQILSSTVAGLRSWIDAPTGGGTLTDCNFEGGNARSIYLSTQIIDGGDSEF